MAKHQPWIQAPPIQVKTRSNGNMTHIILNLDQVVVFFWCVSVATTQLWWIYIYCKMVRFQDQRLGVCGVIQPRTRGLTLFVGRHKDGSVNLCACTFWRLQRFRSVSFQCHGFKHIDKRCLAIATYEYSRGYMSLMPWSLESTLFSTEFWTQDPNNKFKIASVGRIWSTIWSH